MNAEDFIQKQLEEIKTQRRLLGESHPDIANSMNALALYFHHVIRNHEEALNFHTQALTILQAQPDNTHDVEMAVTIVDIGNVYRILGSTEAAISKYTEALRIFQANRIPETHPAVGAASRGMRLLQRTNNSTNFL